MPTPAAQHGESIETLYSHPDVRIIAFSAAHDATSEAGGNGLLPWSSKLESTIAVGSFRIYRAPGSVAFLNCGSALKPIMPKGQCWSVTETDSRFVLQIRRPNFWRIELPDSTAAEIDQARRLRQVFDEIMLFEKTPCPFDRPFTVTLPNQVLEPLTKKKWTPSQRSTSVDYSKTLEVSPPPARVLTRRLARVSTTPLSGSPTISRESRKPQAEESLATNSPESSEAIGVLSRIRTYPTPPSVTDLADDINERLTADKSQYASPTDTGQQFEPATPTQARLSETPADCDPTPKAQPPLLQRLCTPLIVTSNVTLGYPEPTLRTPVSADVPDATFERPGLHADRRDLDIDVPGPSLPVTESLVSKSLPLSLASPAPQEVHETSDEAETGVEDDARSILSSSSSIDSFHSTQSWGPREIPVLSSSAMYRSNERAPDPIQSRDPSIYESTTSLMTDGDQSDEVASLYTPDGHSIAASDASAVSSSADSGISDELRSTISDQMRRRRRDVALLPANEISTATLRLQERERLPLRVRSLPALLIAKTCGLLLRPPGYLLSLMLKVAARIVAGERQGSAMGHDASGDRIAVDWDYSDAE